MSPLPKYIKASMLVFFKKNYVINDTRDPTAATVDNSESTKSHRCQVLGNFKDYTALIAIRHPFHKQIALACVAFDSGTKGLRLKKDSIRKDME